MMDARIAGSRPQIACAGGALESFAHEMADDGTMIVKIGNARIDVELVEVKDGDFRLKARGHGLEGIGFEIRSIKVAVESAGMIQLIACFVE